MPGINIDLAGLTAAVAKVKGVNASVKEFIAQIEPRMQAAVAAAVAKAQAENQDVAAAANAAIAAVSSELSAEADALGAAIVTNPGPTDPPVDPGTPTEGFRRR